MNFYLKYIINVKVFRFKACLFLTQLLNVHRGPSLNVYSIKVTKLTGFCWAELCFVSLNFSVTFFFLSWAGAHFGRLFGHEMFLSNRCTLSSVKLDKSHCIVCNAEASFISVVMASIHILSLSNSLRNHVPGQKTQYHISRLKSVAWDELLHPIHPGNMEATWYY